MKSRGVLVVLVTALVGLFALPGFAGDILDQYSTVTEYYEETGVELTAFNEAPMLSELVSEGVLPPVADRLPKEPLVLIPYEEIGNYGGEMFTFCTLTSIIVEGGWSMNETTLRLDRYAGEVLPNLAHAFEFSDDARTFTLHLREGLHWSDGTPATASDIMFWWEDQMLNTEITPVVPSQWRPGDQVMEVTALDDYTVQFEFAVPYLNFPYRLIGGMYLPQHYLQQFHPMYTDADELAATVSAAGYDQWYQLFSARNSYLENPDRPTLNAWKLTSIDSERGIFERNPYYWKVDTEGNQLPYIDRKVVNRGGDPEVINMMALQGQLDRVCAAMQLENYPLYIENREQGDYSVKLWNLAFQSSCGFMFNLTYEDPVLREIMNDVRFRQAMSLAIDREEINEGVFFGLGVPQQSAMPPMSRFYNPEHANAYAEFDPERANALLDEMGLVGRDREGFRVGPDGDTVFILFETTDIGAARGLRAVWPLVQNYWNNIGIKTDLRLHERTFFDTRLDTNEIAATIWGITGAVEAELFTTTSFLLIGPHSWYNNSWWGMNWWHWLNTDGESGEEPPAIITELWRKYQAIQMAESREEQERLINEILAAQAENLWVIGTVTQTPQPILVRNDVRNFVDEAAWTVMGQGYMVSNPAQWFFAD